MSKLFKKITSIALILVSVIICSVSTIANDNTGKKLYLIKNPENGVLRVVDDNGKTLVKTETGLRNEDFDEWERQENIHIKNIDGYNVIVKETDVNKRGQELEMYDSDGNFISYIDNRFSPKKFSNGKLIYTTNSKIFEYDINKRSSKIYEGTIDSPLDNISQYNSLLPSRNKATTEEINTENISILKNLDGSLMLTSKKYGFVMDGVKEYREYENCTNVKVYEIISKNFISYVNADGRLIAEVHKSFDFDSNDYSDQKLHFIDDKYIIVSTGDRNGASYLLKYSDKPLVIEDVNDGYDEMVWKEWRIVVFGEVLLKENDTINYKVRDIDGTKYLLLYGKEKKAYSTDGTLLNNILFNYNYTLIKKGGKCYLYNAKNELIKDDIDTFALIDIKAEREYTELSHSIIVKVKDKFQIVNQDGSVFVSNLDESIVNKGVKYDSYVKTKEQFITAKADGKINLYDRDGKIILSNLDNHNVIRSGNYFVTLVDGMNYIYNVNGDKMLEMTNGNEYSYDILDIYGRAYRIVTNENEEIYGYYSDFSKKVNTKYPCFCDINGDLCVEQNGFYNLYDINNNILLKDYKFLMRYDDKYLIYQKGFNYGLIDRDGNVKFKFSIFDSASDDE